MAAESQREAPATPPAPDWNVLLGDDRVRPTPTHARGVLPPPHQTEPPWQPHAVEQGQQRQATVNQEARDKAEPGDCYRRQEKEHEQQRQRQRRQQQWEEDAHPPQDATRSPQLNGQDEHGAQLRPLLSHWGTAMDFAFAGMQDWDMCRIPIMNSPSWHPQSLAPATEPQHFLAPARPMGPHGRTPVSDAGLPPPWQVYVSVQHQRVFYYNPVTEESVWDRPMTLPIPRIEEGDAAGGAAPGFGLPPPWQAFISDQYQQFFYYNPQTEESLWERPEVQPHAVDAEGEDTTSVGLLSDRGRSSEYTRLRCQHQAGILDGPDLLLSTGGTERTHSQNRRTSSSYPPVKAPPPIATPVPNRLIARPKATLAEIPELEVPAQDPSTPTNASS